jgi:hypothetical protein
MTIVNAVAIHPRSGEVWDELQKQLRKSIEIVKKHGGENVTLLVTVIGGQQTNSLTMLVTAENWTRFGQIQEAVYGDPKMQALMRETGKITTWEIYTAQTLELRSQSQKRCPTCCGWRFGSGLVGLQFMTDQPVDSVVPSSDHLGN